MDSTKMTVYFFVVLLVSSTTFAWSQKTHSPKGETARMIVTVGSRPKSTDTLLTSDSKPSEDLASSTGSSALEGHEEGQESKIRARYSGLPGKYILEEDDHGKGGEEFEEAEGHEEEVGNDKLQGYHNVGKKVEDESSNSYSDKGAHSDFKEGGSSFDKHHKDLVAENKENENIKAHDTGEKFGSEALKEHKLGKHKEKSVGHKKHGFKNVYHKEEYGDHKTFHDEFLDNDHQHEYDDAHENRQMQGGKFSKGYKREGENKEFNEGDENHAWGKEGHDGFREGHFEKGGHHVGSKQGHKNNEGHHEASGYRKKHSSHKRKKGEAPVLSHGHGAHQGYDQPMYYHKSHGSHVHSPHAHSVHGGGGSAHGGHYHHHDIQPELPTYGGDHDLQDEVFDDHEERTPKKENTFDNEVAEKLKFPSHDHERPGLAHADGRLPAPVDAESPTHSHSESESFSGHHPNANPLTKHRVQYGMPKTHHRHNAQHQQPREMLIRPQPISPGTSMWDSRFEPYRRQPLHQHHGHNRFKPRFQQRHNAPVHHPQPSSPLRSSPYPWWKHSTRATNPSSAVNQPMETFPVPQVATHLPLTEFDAKRFSQPLTIGGSQSPSYRAVNHAIYPDHIPRY